MKKFLLIVALIFFNFSSANAAFESNADKPRILLGEVDSYGEYQLRTDFLQTFYETISAKLSESKKFRVENHIKNFEMPTEEDNLLSTIHMDAIANGRLYRRELASVKMMRYGDSIRSKQYYQDDAKTAERLKLKGKPYSLTPKIFEEVQTLANEYNVDYMLFCNVVEADIWRKTGGIFATHNDGTYGKDRRMTIEILYYLINTKTGQVYEGQYKNKRTSLISNIIIGKAGDRLTVSQMVKDILDKQAEELANDAIKNGLNKIR